MSIRDAVKSVFNVREIFSLTKGGLPWVLLAVFVFAAVVVLGPYALNGYRLEQTWGADRVDYAVSREAAVDAVTMADYRRTLQELAKENNSLLRELDSGPQLASDSSRPRIQSVEPEKDPATDAATKPAGTPASKNTAVEALVLNMIFTIFWLMVGVFVLSFLVCLWHSIRRRLQKEDCRAGGYAKLSFLVLVTVLAVCFLFVGIMDRATFDSLLKVVTENGSKLAEFIGKLF